MICAPSRWGSVAPPAPVPAGRSVPTMTVAQRRPRGPVRKAGFAFKAPSLPYQPATFDITIAIAAKDTP